MPYGENFPHHAIAMPRGPPGGMPPIHSPQGTHISVPIAQVQPHMQPPMAHPVYLQQPGPMYNSMPPPHHVQPGPPTMVTRNLRGVSMGDMTNAPYYPNGNRPHMMDPARASRRDKPYGNTLYDPYNGAKPAFNDYGDAARKTSRAGFMDQTSRKMSAQGGPRARVGSSGTDWGDSASNNNRFSDHRAMRHNMKDDPVITSDPLRGCHHTWIGAENDEVNELFVGDLPEDVQATEVEAMFVHVVKIKPTRVTLRTSMSSDRPHAFVM